MSALHLQTSLYDTCLTGDKAMMMELPKASDLPDNHLNRSCATKNNVAQNDKARHDSKDCNQDTLLFCAFFLPSGSFFCGVCKQVSAMTRPVSAQLDLFWYARATLGAGTVEVLVFVAPEKCILSLCGNFKVSLAPSIGGPPLTRSGSAPACGPDLGSCGVYGQPLSLLPASFSMENHQQRQ